MQWMRFAGNKKDDVKLYAGAIPAHAQRNQVLGLGKAGPAGVRKWAALGRWLRVAHALMDRELVADTEPEIALRPASLPDKPAFAVSEPSGPTTKFQFVCNRHHIGLIIR